MAAYSFVLYTSPPSRVNVWSSDGAQQCAYNGAIVKIAASPDASQLVLWAEEGSSLVAACINSFETVFKVNGTTVVLCNGSGGVYVSFENETTLKDFAKSLRSALPTMPVVVDVEQLVSTDTASTAAGEMESFMSDFLSAPLLDELSDLMADNDVSVDLLDWDILDF